MNKKIQKLVVGLLLAPTVLSLVSVGAQEDTPFVEGPNYELTQDNQFLNFTTPEVEKKVSSHLIEDGEAEYDGVADLSAPRVDSAVSNIDRNIEYEFNVHIPENIEDYKTFTLTDEIPSVFKIDSLDLEKVSVKVDGESVDVDKSLTDRLLKLDFNKNQLTLLGAVNTDRITPLTLVVEFVLEVDPEKAETDLKVPNTVKLNWDNNMGGIGEKEDTVEIELKEGILEVLKKDGKAEQYLPGAEFKLYRQLDDVQLKEGLKGETVKGVNNLVPATDSSKADISVIKVDENGRAVVPELPFGKYYLQETKAPAGYRLVTALTEIDVNDTENTVEYETVNVADGISVTIDNFKSSDPFPATGTYGVLGLVGVASVLVIGAVAVGRKANKEEA